MRRQFRRINCGNAYLQSRLEYGEPLATAHLFEVRLDNEGRDDGGFLWGRSPTPLWCLRCLKYSEHFCRAHNREEALAHFRKRWPDLQVFAKGRHRKRDEKGAAKEKEETTRTTTGLVHRMR